MANFFKKFPLASLVEVKFSIFPARFACIDFLNNEVLFPGRLTLVGHGTTRLLRKKHAPPFHIKEEWSLQ